MSEENKFFLPPKSDDKNDKKTLVLDLDETLLHSQYIKFTSTENDIVLKIEFENEPKDIHILIRPGAKEFIRKMNKLYEIVIFTASVSKYATPLINLIDERGVCAHKLFREHCSLVNTLFIKDLTKLGRDLKDIIIIDNTPTAFSLNKENGIPITTWFEDDRDRELYNLIPILEFLSSVPDVREFIPKFVINGEVSYLASMDIMRKHKNNNNKQYMRYKTANMSNIKPVEKILKEEKVNSNLKILEEKKNENENIETKKKNNEKSDEIDIENIIIENNINLAELLGDNNGEEKDKIKSSLEINEISKNKEKSLVNKDNDKIMNNKETNCKINPNENEATDTENMANKKKKENKENKDNNENKEKIKNQ